MRGLLVSLFACFPVAAIASDVSIALTNQPPYMIEATETGIFVDLFREAFRAGGHTAKLQFLPNRRAFASFEAKKVDGVLYYFGENAPGSCRTEEYGNYQPTLIALKKNNFSIKRLEDLKGRLVSAFLGAKDYFAPSYPDYSAVIGQAREYREEADITRITKLLLNDRVDIGVVDWRIFLWTAQAEPDGNLYAVKDVEKHPYFATAWVGAQLWNPDHCRDFNRGLAILKKDGRYDAIYEKYSDDSLQRIAKF